MLVKAIGLSDQTDIETVCAASLSRFVITRNGQASPLGRALGADDTRQSFYTWKRRYDELGREGLKDRSRRPKVSPRVLHVEVVGIVPRLVRSQRLAGTARNRWSIPIPCSHSPAPL